MSSYYHMIPINMWIPHDRVSGFNHLSQLIQWSTWVDQLEGLILEEVSHPTILRDPNIIKCDTHYYVNPTVKVNDFIMLVSKDNFSSFWISSHIWHTPLVIFIDLLIKIQSSLLCEREHISYIGYMYSSL